MDELNESEGPSELARRQFLANVLRLSGGALVLFAGVPIAEGSTQAPAAKPGDGYDWNEHRYAYLIDTAKCIGCGSCVRACAAENKVPDGFFRTWIERYVVGMEDSHVDSPNGGKDGFPPIQVGFVATKHFFVPKICNHCRETPCTQVCPVGASYRTKDGVVLVDAESCIGCAYCVQACPYGTRMFGDMKREDDPVRQAIEHDRVSILQGHLLTEPQCFYLNLDREVR
jgi:tetrathionate reductase subunit B